jgi:hypothetical protein
VVVVNPKVPVFLGDSPGDEVIAAHFNGVSGLGELRHKLRHSSSVGAVGAIRIRGMYAAWA